MLDLSSLTEPGWRKTASGSISPTPQLSFRDVVSTHLGLLAGCPILSPPLICDCRSSSVAYSSALFKRWVFFWVDRFVSIGAFCVWLFCFFKNPHHTTGYCGGYTLIYLFIFNLTPGITYFIKVTEFKLYYHVRWDISSPCKHCVYLQVC